MVLQDHGLLTKTFSPSFLAMKGYDRRIKGRSLKEVIFMTQNQIAYWRLQEEKRSNLASEGETSRHNMTTEKETERSNRVQQGETKRHNLSTESQAWLNYSESQRSNRANESIKRDTLAESARHNVATESELSRHNLATESESVRHNVESEILGRGQLALQHGQLQEQTRHNVATEIQSANTLAETIRSNMAKEQLQMSAQAEVARHNYQSEYLTATGIVQQANALSETTRHNKALEGIQQQQANTASQRAANDYSYQYNMYQVAQRNAATAEMQANTGAFNAVTNYMLGYDTLAETTRHNQSTEDIQRQQNYIKMGDVLLRTLPDLLVAGGIS